MGDVAQALNPGFLQRLQAAAQPFQPSSEPSHVARAAKIDGVLEVALAQAQDGLLETADQSGNVAPSRADESDGRQNGNAHRQDQPLPKHVGFLLEGCLLLDKAFADFVPHFLQADFDVVDGHSQGRGVLRADETRIRGILCKDHRLQILADVLRDGGQARKRRDICPPLRPGLRVVVEGILVFEDFVAPQASFHVGQVLGDFQRQAGVFGEITDGDLVAAIERLQCEEGVSGDEQERQDDQRVTIGDQVNERAGVASHERFR